jgi:hypothetical protein
LPQGIAHGADFLRPFRNLRKLGGVKITLYGEFAEDFPNSTGSILALSPVTWTVTTSSRSRSRNSLAAIRALMARQLARDE